MRGLSGRGDHGVLRMQLRQLHPLPVTFGAPAPLSVLASNTFTQWRWVCSTRPISLATAPTPLPYVTQGDHMTLRINALQFTINSSRIS
ncbi:hypothetical protein CKO27_19510 [Thiocystis violacea]|nr:hypothetical protein [Thiocystis violacea]